MKNQVNVRKFCVWAMVFGILVGASASGFGTYYVTKYVHGLKSANTMQTFKMKALANYCAHLDTQDKFTWNTESKTSEIASKLPKLR